MTTIQRETFLGQLEAVQPGLSSRDIIEQSSCYIFRDGQVITYNDEIACSHVCKIGVEGAVRSGVLLEILRKLPEDELMVEQSEKGITLRGKGRECFIAREVDIRLPINNVEKPTKWKPLSKDVIDAIELAHHCASDDETEFRVTCVHITPHHIEACDNTQMTRVKVETGVTGKILVRKNSIRHITTLAMEQFCETETWVHFRNSSGLVLSCRRFIEEYPTLDKLLDFKGDKIVLPKGLADAADRAAIFARETPDDPKVMVELRTDKLRVCGTGASGEYKEIKKLNYKGPEFSFRIAPQLLMDITKRYNEAEINQGRLRVNGGKWTYISCLSPVTKEK